MIALSVNLNKIALIRNSRDTTNPDIPEHARMVIAAGADGITVHPRPDQRHIRAGDCFDLAALLPKLGNHVELNIEGNPFAGPRASERSGVGDYPGFMELVEEIRPAQCTLVPDGDVQLTSDHGLAKNFIHYGKAIEETIEMVATTCFLVMFLRKAFSLTSKLEINVIDER